MNYNFLFVVELRTKAITVVMSFTKGNFTKYLLLLQATIRQVPSLLYILKTKFCKKFWIIGTIRCYLFFLIFTVAFLLFLAPAGDPNPAGQSLTLILTKPNLNKPIKSYCDYLKKPMMSPNRRGPKILPWLNITII